MLSPPLSVVKEQIGAIFYMRPHAVRWSWQGVVTVAAAHRSTGLLSSFVRFVFKKNSKSTQRHLESTDETLIPPRDCLFFRCLPFPWDLNASKWCLNTGIAADFWTHQKKPLTIVWDCGFLKCHETVLMPCHKPIAVNNRQKMFWFPTQVILGIGVEFPRPIFPKLILLMNLRYEFMNQQTLNRRQHGMTMVDFLSSHQIRWDGRVNETDGLLRRLVWREGYDFWICLSTFKLTLTAVLYIGTVQVGLLDEELTRC